MNYLRMVLAGLCGFAAYFIVGGLSFVVVPSLKNEFLKYPAIYRAQDEMKTVMPLGMVAMLIAMFALAAIYALAYQGGPGWMEGARFGALVGVFAIGSFVVHNYVNLNIGATLTLQQAVAYFVEWVITGVVIGLIYRPLPGH